jgi:exosome complex component RRP42
MSKSYIATLAEKDARIDGRKFDELRKPIKVELGISNKAEGSAKVTWGETEVFVGVKMAVGTPYPDSPDQGVLITGAEMSPMSDPEFLPGPPSPVAIEVARVVDRGIRESKMIDTKKLCIKEGELVWTVFLDIYPLNNDGNLIDAAALGAVAALKSAVFPKLENDRIVFGEFTKTKIPLNLLPITCTVISVDGKAIVDPCLEEEKNFDARINVAVSEKGDIHAMQKGGFVGLDIDEADKMIGLAVKKSAEIRKALK